MNAQGSQQETLIWNEDIFGSSPVDVVASVLPVTENNLQLKKDTLNDPTLNKNRQPSGVKGGMIKIDGDLKFPLRYADYDSIIESALQGVWSGDVVKSGSTKKYLGIQKGFTDVDVYNKYIGLAVDELSIDLKPNSLVECTATFIGKNMLSSNVSVTTTPTSASDNEPFDSFNGSIIEDGTELATITGFSVSIKNGLSASEAVMQKTAIGITSSTLEVSGKVDCYFTGSKMLNKFLEETESSIVITLIDRDGQSHTITFPNVKYLSGDPNVKEGDIIQTLDFIASYDPTSDTTISFTR